MKLQNDDDELLIICSFRYALANQRAIGAFVIRQLIVLWRQMSLETQSTIHTEINRAIKRRRIPPCDADHWNKLLNMPCVVREPKS